MIPHHVYYQLAIVGFLWLCIMLYYVWPSQNAASPPLPTAPLPPGSKRKRTSEPQPFEGLTQRPLCAACEHDAQHPHVPPSRRPDPMPPTHRRPCTIDTSRHFCPHAGCDDQGGLGLGNIRANGHPSGGPCVTFRIICPTFRIICPSDDGDFRLRQSPSSPVPSLRLPALSVTRHSSPLSVRSVSAGDGAT